MSPSPPQTVYRCRRANTFALFTRENSYLHKLSLFINRLAEAFQNKHIHFWLFALRPQFFHAKTSSSSPPSFFFFFSPSVFTHSHSFSQSLLLASARSSRANNIHRNIRLTSILYSIRSSSLGDDKLPVNTTKYAPHANKIYISTLQKCGKQWNHGKLEKQSKNKISNPRSILHT